MKTYFTLIKYTQQILLGISIIMLATLPSALVFYPDFFTEAIIMRLYAVAHISLFLVMLIRPLADMCPKIPLLRPLVILRKGMGVLSASVIVSFMLEKLILDASGYMASFAAPEYWSLTNLALFAHLADFSAIILLITSNNLSKKILGAWWKRVQKLSYMYFYASGIYIFLIVGDTSVFIYLCVVTFMTMLAYLRNHQYIMQPKTTHIV
jgi:DMSO/TMAO reductase YedYZ heme-binding membrane subunit